MFIPLTQRSLVALVLAAALAAGLAPAPAAAAPSAAKIAADRAAADRAANEVLAARIRAQALEASVTAASRQLDTLLAEQQAAQRSLSAHVALTYRFGVTSFIEVITSATSFEDFATRLFFLTRVSEQDAVAITRLKAARRASLAQAKRLIALQEQAAAELSAASGAAERARTELAGSRAAYAAYLRRLSAATPAPKAKRSAPSPKYTGSGKGAWQSAKASHYGKGSWGHKTADGTRIKSDSMIVAHKTLPFGTLVEFEYDGKRAVARVADRGPYVKGRAWDLGPGVISVLDFNGVHTVRYRIIGR